MEIKLDKDFALFYGIMLGDGCLSLTSRKKKLVAITCSLKDDLSFMEEIVRPILLKFRGKDTKIRFKEYCGAVEFSFSDFNLFDFIHSFGFPIGKKGVEIKIPRVFYDRGLVKYIIQGFFATDGSLVLTKNPNKYYPRLESQAIGKMVIKQIYDYLGETGLKGKYYKCKFKKSEVWDEQDRYKFQFNGKKNLLIFNDMIGFVNPKHKKRFEKFIIYNSKYDSAIKGLPSKKIKSEGMKINGLFERDMALGRVELPISAS